MSTGVGSTVSASSNSGLLARSCCTHSVSHECTTDSMAPMRIATACGAPPPISALICRCISRRRCAKAAKRVPATVRRKLLSRRSSSSTPSSSSSAAMRLDSADCVMNSFSAARVTLFSDEAQ